MSAEMCASDRRLRNPCIRIYIRTFILILNTCKQEARIREICNFFDRISTKRTAFIVTYNQRFKFRFIQFRSYKFGNLEQDKVFPNLTNAYFGPMLAQVIILSCDESIKSRNMMCSGESGSFGNALYFS